MEYIIIINIHAFIVGALYFIKQTLTDTKGQIDSYLIIVNHFTTPLSSLDSSTKLKMNKKLQLKPSN